MSTLSGLLGGTFRGAQGAQGIQGAIGPQGVQGAQGEQGATGADSTVAGPQGVQGAQGHQGEQGAVGSQGSQGFQGVQGAQGHQGEQGAVGSQGSQGFQGVQGAQGHQGIIGPSYWIETNVGIHTLSNVGIGTTNPRVAIDAAEKTDAIALPQGTTAQRPTGSAPYIRKNTTNNALEYYDGTNWVELITDYFPSGSTILG